VSRKNYDGIVTMYHDQGQIALKLIGFDGGVTVQGGLPVVIATPAHGTVLDITGKNIASATSSQNALDVAIAVATKKVARES
jgi:4-hydroxy-L-threonine phosphate dehydrogenase PdxA